MKIISKLFYFAIAVRFLQDWTCPRQRPDNIKNKNQLKIDLNSNAFPVEPFGFQNFHGVENHIAVSAKIETGIFCEIDLPEIFR